MSDVSTTYGPEVSVTAAMVRTDAALLSVRFQANVGMIQTLIHLEPRGDVVDAEKRGTN